MNYACYIRKICVKLVLCKINLEGYRVKMGPISNAEMKMSTANAGTILMARLRRKSCNLSRNALPVIKNPLKAKNSGRIVQ